VVLLQARVDFVAQDALAHAVDEHNATQLFLFRDVHHAVEMLHLKGQLGPVLKATLVVDKFMDVQVYFHVRVTPHHVGGL
jgi:hypothetical protein